MMEDLYKMNIAVINIIIFISLKEHHVVLSKQAVLRGQ